MNQSSSVEVKCIDCGSMFTISRSGYNTKLRNNDITFRCKSCMSKHRTEMMIKRNAERTEEQKQKQREAASKSKKQYWDKLSKEDKDKHMDKLNQAAAEWRENETEEERIRISQIHSESNKRRWESMNEEQRKEFINKCHDAWEEKVDLIEFGNKIRNIWESLSPERKKELTRKKISSSGKSNKLNIKFNSYFSKIPEEYMVYSFNEHQTINNNTKHFWDYGVFDENGEMFLLVDLDGEYYHGDKYDYDGIHGKIHYDIKRSSSIPEGIIPCIIMENNFDKCFQRMIHLLSLTYDQYIDEMFNEMRLQPFPYPHYSDIELCKSYDQLQRMNPDDGYQSLSINTRLGDRIIYHFHISMWDEIIPLWNDDNMLRYWIKTNKIYQNHLNPNKILQNLIPVKIFSASKVRLIINKFLTEYGEIFCPFNGYSNVMLGTISAGKRYIGYDDNETLLEESFHILEFLDKYKIQHNVSLVRKPDNEYRCLLATYVNDDQIDYCVNNYKCEKYVFVVSKTEKYSSKIIDIIDNEEAYEENEYVIVIK